jgi:hypothetical protein
LVLESIDIQHTIDQIHNTTKNQHKHPHTIELYRHCVGRRQDVRDVHSIQACGNHAWELIVAERSAPFGDGFNNNTVQYRLFGDGIAQNRQVDLAQWLLVLERE